MSNVKTAKHWASRGYRVFPIVKGKKIPLLPWKINATSDPEVAEAMFGDEDFAHYDETGDVVTRSFKDADVGMIIPEDQCVIDLDVKNGVDGYKAWEEACEGVLDANTLRVRTPSGGLHIYYSTSTRIKNTSNQIAPGVDTRGGGLGFCVAPGCQGYEVEHDPGPDQLIGLPYVIASDTRLHRDASDCPTLKQDVDLSHIDPEEMAGLTDRYMNQQKINAVEEGYGPGNRDVIINRVLAGLHGIGVPEEEAGDLINRMDAELADGGYEDIDRALRSVYRNNTTQQGFGQEYHKRYVEYMAGGGDQHSLERLAAAVPRSEARATQETGEFRWLSCEDLEKLPPVKWLVDGWVPTSSMGLVFGPYGTFKTFMVLDLCLTLASAEGREVLYVPGEGLHDVRQRVAAWKIYKGVREVGGFHVCPSVPRIAEDEHFGGFLQACREQGGYQPIDLIVFDTMYYAAMGFEENSSKEAMLFLGRLQQGLRSVWPDVTVLLIGHTSKNNEDELRGSVAIPSAMDFSIQVKKRQEGVSTVRLSKQKAGADGLERHFETREVTTGFDEQGRPLSTLVVTYDGVRAPREGEGEIFDHDRAARALQEDVALEVVIEELARQCDEKIRVRALVNIVAEEFCERLHGEPLGDQDAARKALMSTLVEARKSGGRLSQFLSRFLGFKCGKLSDNVLQFDPGMDSCLEPKEGTYFYEAVKTAKMQVLENKGQFSVHQNTP